MYLYRYINNYMKWRYEMGNNCVVRPNKQYITVLSSLTLVVTASFSTANTLLEFNRSTTPLIKIATPKPNIYICF